MNDKITAYTLAVGTMLGFTFGGWQWGSTANLVIITVIIFVTVLVIVVVVFVVVISIGELIGIGIVSVIVVVVVSVVMGSHGGVLVLIVRFAGIVGVNLVLASRICTCGWEGGGGVAIVILHVVGTSSMG